jgi:RNA-binding protein
MLTNRQKKQLKGLAQKLAPQVMLGKLGLSAAVTKQTDTALNDHELVKVKIAVEEKAQCLELGRELSTQVGAELVQIIGRMMILYRASEKATGTKISLA